MQVLLLLPFIFLTSLILTPGPAPGEDAQRPVRIGVLAKRGPEQCLKRWGPTGDYLDARIPDHDFTIVPLGFDEIRPAVARQDVDFVLANSSFYVQLEVELGARRIVTLENLHTDGSSQTEFAGLLFTRRDRTDLNTVADLKGKTFMAVDEKSLGGWHMQWFKLQREGFDPYREFASLSFGGSHDAVVYAVLRGEVDAGGVRSDTVERMALEGKIDRDDIRVIAPDEDCGGGLHFLHSTRHYPEWPLARAAHTPDELSKRVATALLQMSRDDPAARAAHCSGWSTPQNYQVVRECLQALRLPPYENFGRVTLLEAVRKVWPWLLGIFLLSVLILLVVLRAVRLKARLEQSEELAASREQAWSFVQGVLDALPVGVLLIDSEKREVRMANPHAATMIGRKPDDLIGRNCHDFICPAQQDRCPILDLDQEMDHTEKVLLTVDRGPIPILKTVVPMQIDGVPYLLETFIDISERKAAEAERERLALAIDQAGEMILTTDPDGLVQYVNPAFERISGYSRDEAIGRRLSFLKSGRQDGEFYREMWRTITRGETWTGRFVNRRKDGTLFTGEATITPVRDGEGRIVSYVSVNRDITAQLELEKQYRQSQKMETIGRLAGGLAHDYNNMMGVILGYTELILDRGDLLAHDRDELEEIRTAAERSARLTRQLLGFARKQTIEPRVLDMNQVLDDMFKMLKRLIGEDVVLDWRPGQGIWHVLMDPSQVDQIVVNLCVNARDALSDGGLITIETANNRIEQAPDDADHPFEPGDYLTISVRDDGCGMAPEILEHVFEPFFTTKKMGEGSGLGLATVYGIVKQNKGFIHIDSAPDQGTTVAVHLPRHHAPAPAQQAPISGGRTCLSGTETILLVEDEPALLASITKMLRLQGYTVLPTSRPSEALELVAGLKSAIDLVISDVVMPGMNGVELARQLGERYPDLRCLLMSGYSANAIADEGHLLSGMPFLRKPFSMRGLTLKVRETLDVNRVGNDPRSPA